MGATSVIPILLSSCLAASTLPLQVLSTSVSKLRSTAEPNMCCSLSTQRVTCSLCTSSHWPLLPLLLLWPGLLLRSRGSWAKAWCWRSMASRLLRERISSWAGARSVASSFLGARSEAARSAISCSPMPGGAPPSPLVRPSCSCSLRAYSSSACAWASLRLASSSALRHRASCASSMLPSYASSTCCASSTDTSGKKVQRRGARSRHRALMHCSWLSCANS
mmetsp:Transcript_15672/g.39069  ORF Transcript_15672/g.39069 Transcript_15672/m.39069 type:complete len:221 (-) Transcript_15672:1282-1944(-)